MKKITISLFGMVFLFCLISVIAYSPPSDLDNVNLLLGNGTYSAPVDNDNVNLVLGDPDRFPDGLIDCSTNPMIDTYTVLDYNVTITNEGVITLRNVLEVDSITRQNSTCRIYLENGYTAYIYVK